MSAADFDYEDEWETPDIVLNNVDGHWYQITYGRAPFRYHATDCPTCTKGDQS